MDVAYALSTLLFTDVVRSTERAAAVGDARWRDLVERHHDAVRRELTRFRGREVDTAVELAGDSLRGIAVHTGARIAALANANEVLVSGTVRDLIAGSGIDLVERGVHRLKGVPCEWRVYAPAQ